MSNKRRVFITSDWHLGGRADVKDDEGRILTPGSQICRSLAQLTDFIDWVRDQKVPGCITELVLNGDIVDFLAPDEEYEPQRWLGNESLAVKRFNEIADRTVTPKGRGPFDALRDLLASGCELTILLGNHDIEWSLPAVRSALIARIGAAGRRFNFIYDGEACVRGKLLIEHGNRYDPFNVIDHSALRQERSHLSRGLKCAEDERKDNFFLPPYGTELVTQVFNRLLPKVPFLNLLKPEKEAVLPLLLAICPESRKLLDDAVIVFGLAKSGVVNRLRRPAQPLRAGQLAVQDSGKYRSISELLTDSLGADAKWFAPEEPTRGNLANGRPLRERLNKLVERGLSLREKITPWEDIVNILSSRTDEKRLQQLRIALRKVNDATIFDPFSDNGTYVEAARELVKEGGFTAVVFGHTHLAKRIELDDATYFNCGTWADLLRLPEEVAVDDTTKVDDAISRFVDDMIKMNIKPYLWRCLSFVDASIESNGSVAADIFQYIDKERPSKLIMRTK